MKKNLLLLLFLILPSNAAFCITTTVPAGTIQTGGDINTIVTQQVYGQADNFTIYGHQQVMSGGITNNSNIYTYGQQTVYSGGTSYNTSIISQGLQVIYGKSYNSTAQSNGNININSGGTAYSSIINGGKITVLSGGTSSGTILNSGTESINGTSSETLINGGLQQINRYGQSQNSKLNGGSQTILVRGTAKNTIITSGTQNVYGDSIETELKSGIMNIYSTGYAENTTISGGTMNVNSGGFSSQTTLQQGTQNIYGQDINGTILGGIQNIMDGGVAEDTIIQGGIQNIGAESYAFNNIILDTGIQQIASGGYSYRSQVSSGGTINTSGEIYEANVSYGGTLNILDNALAQDTTLKGGSMNIEANGTSQNTSIFDGIMNVYGSDNNTTITGGTQNIQSNGTSTNAIIKSSGVQNIYAEGTSSEAQINLGGKQIIFASGLANKSTLNGGVQIVYGTTNNTIVNSGLQEIRSNGTAFSSQITHGGILTVEDGGTANNTSLTNATLRLQPGGNLSGITNATNSIINISGDHTIPDLQIDNSLVNITHKPQFSTIHFTQLDGNGIFIMNSDLAAGISDQITISSGNGDFGLIINDYSNGPTPSQFKIIDESSSAVDNFYLIGDAIDVGAFRYQLQQEGNNWYLKSTNHLSDGVYIAKNTFTSLSSLFFSHLSPVYNRLNFHRNFSKHDNGLWVKGIARRIKQNHSDSSSSNTDIYGESIGFDHQIYHSNNLKVSAGIYSGFTVSEQKFDISGQGDGQTYSFGLYSTLLSTNRWFFNIMGTYFIHNQKTKSYTPADTQVMGKFDTYGWQTAFSLGKRFDLSNHWFIEPFIGLNYMYINGVSYHTNFDTLIQAADTDYLSNTMGVTFGRSFTIEDIALDTYAQADITYDWDAKNSIQVADYSTNDNMASLHYELTAGINASWNMNSSSYLELTTQLGNKVHIPWELSLGYQYEF